MKAIVTVLIKLIYKISKFLINNNFEIYSTGGTYKLLKEKIQHKKIFKISDITNFEEILMEELKHYTLKYL